MTVGSLTIPFASELRVRWRDAYEVHTPIDMLKFLPATSMGAVSTGFGYANRHAGILASLLGNLIGSLFLRRFGLLFLGCFLLRHTLSH